MCWKCPRLLQRELVGNPQADWLNAQCAALDIDAASTLRNAVGNGGANFAARTVIARLGRIGIVRHVTRGVAPAASDVQHGTVWFWAGFQGFAPLPQQDAQRVQRPVFVDPRAALPTTS